MKTKNKFLLIPDEELHKLEEKYGYTSKSELVNEVKTNVRDHGEGKATGDLPTFHVFQMSNELEDQISKIQTRATKINDAARVSLR